MYLLTKGSDAFLNLESLLCSVKLAIIENSLLVHYVDMLFSQESFIYDNSYLCYGCEKQILTVRLW